MIVNKLPTIVDRLGKVFDSKKQGQVDKKMFKIGKRDEEDDDMDIQHNPLKF